MVEVIVEAAPDAAVQKRVSGALVTVPPGETKPVELNGAQLGQLRAYCRHERARLADDDEQRDLPRVTHTTPGGEQGDEDDDEAEASDAWRTDYRAAQQLASRLDLPATGTHEELIDRIQTHHEEDSE